MAVAMAQQNATAPEDTMDIDIDMDVDVDDMGPIAEEQPEEGEQTAPMAADEIEAGEVPAIYLEDPSQEPQWEKIHLRGVDDLSTDNIRRFASDYFPDADPYVQWIDDTSANLVYKDKSIARKAFKSLVMHDVSDEEIVNNPTIPRTAKTLVTHPGSILTVRVAVMADRKKRGARDASRYYLMNPEADPGERERRQQAARRGNGDSGDYKRRRFDEAEHRRRRRHQDDSLDASNDFAASMYDDAPAESDKPNRSRTTHKSGRPRHRSASPVGNRDTIDLSDSDADSSHHGRRRNGYRRRDSPPPRRRNAGRELFDDTSPAKPGLRSENLDIFSRITKNGAQSERSMSYDTNQGVARQLRADLKAAQNLSPMKSHRRSRAMDSRVEEDLVERFGRKSISLDSTKSVREKTANSGKELFSDDRAADVDMDGGGFSIKGSANQGINIKGRASDVKELFPSMFPASGRSANAGKELFDRPVHNRSSRRTAGDLFD